MRLSWNEIRARAAVFAREWVGASYERGESQSFYNDFFDVFGVKRRRVAMYERQVEKLNNNTGFIDLFWPGVLLVEQKSEGRDLRRAREQADEYCLGLPYNEFPRYILVSDFQSFTLSDLEDGWDCSFRLSDLPDYIENFSFILGIERRIFREQDPLNIEAAELMGRIHDALQASGYEGHRLKQYLVRLLFCLFADDTGIFEPRGAFQDLLEQRTAEDGSDLGQWLSHLFEILDTDESERLATLDHDLNVFPYVNGALFSERLPIAAFSTNMRDLLLEACSFDWSGISPAIFGSLFQSVMDSAERRTLGAHYTSERNILRLIEPLFLDELSAEFESIRSRRTERTRRLREFHQRLARIRVFDPACGCGNFLVIAYREMRRLELKVLRELHTSGQLELDAAALSSVNVDQFYGIELSEFPCRIAEVAMWMMDHIMNNELSLEFGLIYVRIPLRSSPSILQGNAAELDWSQILPSSDCSFICGNPPYAGKKEQSPSQKRDMNRVWCQAQDSGVLDYVSLWFRKAAMYMSGTSIRAAFVATNSITQGEQVAPLWAPLIEVGIAITFAHRTFCWTSEARGRAHVHVVIIGFSYDRVNRPLLFEYDDLLGDPMLREVARINPYLIDAPHLVVTKSQQALNGPSVHYGSFALDDGNYTLSAAEADELVAECPLARKYLRPFLGSKELLNGIERYCIWLENASPAALRSLEPILLRVRRVREWRSQSRRATTRKLAETPMRFAEIRQPDSEYVAIPTASSERRRYIPIDFLPPSVIASNQLYVLPNASLFEFGVLQSRMHQAWVRAVAGRLKSDIRYSTTICYNNFPWPDSPSDRYRTRVSNAAKVLLTVRTKFRAQGNSLADIYDPDLMPNDLVSAHSMLDTAVEALYRTRQFQSDRERAEFLFNRYAAFTSRTTDQIPIL